MLDVNACLGRDRAGSAQAAATATAITAVMDSYGIGRALVYHLAARQVHPADGNRLLDTALAGSTRLLPCWVATPLGDELDDGLDGFFRRLQAARVRAVRLFPVSFHFQVDTLTLGPLFERLQEACLPVMLDWDIAHWSQQPIDGATLEHLAGCFERLPILLMGLTPGQVRGMVPVLVQRPNLVVETSAFQYPDGPAWLARTLGADRVLFGSGLPFAESAMPIQALRRSALSTAERNAIAAANACRVLRLRRGAPSPAPAPYDGPVIDAHTHLGKWYGTQTHSDDAVGLVREMDRCGVSRAALVDLLACGGEDDEGNARVAAAVRQFPDRLLGYATVSPHHPHAERLLLKCLDEYGFRGLKFHCSLHECPPTSDRYRPHWEIAHARGLPILCHGGAERAQMDVLLERYANATFVHAHSGAVYRPGVGEPTVALAQAHPNYVIDLGGSAHQRGALADLVARVGSERIVFGTDFPIFDFAYQMGRVLGAALDETQRRHILHDNAARLFRLPT